MVTSPRPTRAESSDVANAVLDGADALMLSEETAVGLFPLEAVRVMNMISQTIEQKTPKIPEDSGVGRSIDDVIGSLAARATQTVKPAALVVVTRSGFSARMVSKHRPDTRILAVARSRQILRRTRLYWGVEPLNITWTDDRNELLTRAVLKGLDKGYFSEEDTVMFVSGSNLEAPGRTSTLEILRVREIMKQKGLSPFALTVKSSAP
jgi:pyruvate kinase